VVHYVLPKHLVAEEVARLDAALQTTRDELTGLRANRPQQAAAEFDAFLDLHLMILGDEHISHAARAMIQEEHCNARSGR